MTRSRNKPKIKNRPDRKAGTEKQAFIAHVHELKKRFFYIVISIIVFGGLAFSFEDMLTSWLLAPAAGQKFIYTTPGGGFDFLFKLCLYSGIAASIPVITYQIFRYIHPLLKEESRRFMLGCTVWSSLLAITGIAFGYLIGLPTALHFLLQGFSSDQISALITIQSYMSFVIIYLLGTSLLFQIPLILILTNRIKPLSPKKMMKHQKWVILGAVVLGAIISPTSDIRNQLILSGPVILMYEISIGIIWILNRRHRKPRKIIELLKKDAELRTERLARFEQARLTHEAQTRQTEPDVSHSATYNSA